MTDNSDKQHVLDFRDAVNMTARQISDWLDTEDSKRVGSKEEDASESVGHRSGKKIVKIIGKKPPAYTAEDFKHMAKVTAYVKRHLAQRPTGDVSETNWRYSLMNWGHDPVKK